MTLLSSTHTINLVFLPKSFRGGWPPLKMQEGGPYPQAPPDPRLTIICKYSATNIKSTQKCTQCTYTLYVHTKNQFLNSDIFQPSITIIQKI